MLQLKLLDSFSAYDVHASQQYLILRWRQSSFEIPLGGLGLHVLCDVRQRWIYLTSMVRCTINAGLLVKPHIKHHRCAAGGCVAPANKAR